MNFLLQAVFVASALISSAHCAVQGLEWCYHLPTCNDTTWAVTYPIYCNGSRQSPINIVSSAAKVDSNLTEFTFENFDSKSALQVMKNTGQTVGVSLKSGLKFSGGGLPDNYEALQFHLHWGNGASIPGSEHTLDGKRYPMELHIVNIKTTHNGNTTLAFADSTGFAALGFFIDVMSGSATGQPASWKTLTSYLVNITNREDTVSLATGISLDDLLEGVNRTRYYRYLGSLTTPNCNEAVVWTVFKESIKVSKDLIDLFSTIPRINNSTSPLMINVYRDLQPGLPVTTQADSSSMVYHSLGLMVLSLILGICL